MESDSDQSDSKLQFSFKPEPQHQQQTVTSIQIHLPLCINTTCDKPNKCKTMAMSSSDPAENNNNSNLASSSSSAHTNQSTAHESQTSGSSQNVCAYCGQESAEIRPAPSTPYSSTAASSSSSLLLMGLPSQEAAKVRKREAAAELLTLPREDDAAEWIFCDLCHKWFHSICVDVQQYELSLIEKFHCPGCQLHNGPSKMKVKRLLHRYAFDDGSQRELPVQIGTETWIRQFKEDYMKKIPEATAAEMIRVYKDGTELSHKFNFTQNWTEPIKVLNSRGLGLRMPEDEFFDVVDVIKLLGSHVLVDTIDVYAQQSYTMSLNRFYDFWRKRNRDRLYNVLSLEFSETKLAEIIRSPSLVRELSWAQRFWPNNEQQTEDMANLKTIKPDLDIYSFMENTTYHRYAIPAHELEQQEESSRPYVEHFCLMGMKDSYTDFHIDFGGSSVWYHVFRGEKVFFIAPPSAQNLAAFLGWQKNKQRAEIFFDELLPPGQKLYRLHVRERETLFLPSGWIHSVYTPKDSIVFGGNFLHNLNVPMQLKVFQLEADAETEERFKFPFFELCNFYAGKSISESLKDLTAEGELADQVLLDAATALHTKCAEWLQLQPEKFAIFNGTLKLMERELSRQQCLQRRIGGKTVKGSGNGGHSTPIPDPMAGMPKLEPEPPSATTSQRVCQFEVRRDLDSSWEEFEEDEDHSESADDEAQQQSTHGQRATSSSNRGHQLRKYVLKPRGISREGSADSPATAVVEFESQGPVRLKIKLPCWRRSSEQQHPADVQTKRAKYANKKQMMAEPESEANLDVGAMFTGKSAHGRQLRPTARITDIVDGPEHAKATDLFTETFSSEAHQNHQGKEKDSDFLTAVRAGSSSNSTRGGNKSFMAQFSAEEKRQIELADKAAELDARGELFTTPPPKIRATAKKRNLQTVGQKLNAGGNETVTGGDNNVPTTSTQKLPKAQKDTAVEKKPKKVGPLGSRERLAKKLGLNRKK